MLSRTCPISDVDRALSPYVHSREETLRIRRTLTKYLVASIRPVNVLTQTQHSNQEVPQALSAVGTNPPGLKGTRAVYLDAIRANKAARTKLQSIQVSLKEEQQRHVIEAPADESHHEATQSYIALLRLRRQVAELNVIKESLEKLLNASPIVGIRDLRERVTDSIGEQPNLPVERLESLSHSKHDDSLILQLKKEVLEARSSMEEAKAARSKAHATARAMPGMKAQVYALSRAREEIVEWVQQELAKLEEESGFIEDTSPIKHSAAVSGDQDTMSESLIQSCYTQYTASRSAAIHLHQSIQKPTETHSVKSERSQVTSPQPSTHEPENKPVSLSTTSLLPYLPHLMRADTNERDLLLQAVHLQSQMTLADEEANDSLSRLSGESHLLPSGSKGIESWGKMATQLEDSNENGIKQRLQGSRTQINSITTIVDLCSLQSQVLNTQ